jgi:hypothetical protein
MINFICVIYAQVSPKKAQGTQKQGYKQIADEFCA